MKKSKILKPINVMTTSFLLASSLLMPSAGFAEEPSTPKNEGNSNSQESGVQNQETRTQTAETQSSGKAAAKKMRRWKLRHFKVVMDYFMPQVDLQIFP
ncbi:hypothetical protein JMN23_12580 [Bacillus sp. RHFB]|nr:hypothetical protein [Bacillus sp. RHFB]